MRPRRRPSSEAQICPMDRGSTLGSPLWVTAPSRICTRGCCASTTQRSSSWTCEVHMPKATCGSCMGSTVRGGPGTSSFLLMEGSKHRSAVAGASPELLSIFSRRPRQASSLHRTPSAAFLAAPLGAAAPASPASSMSASMYSPMNSRRQATASARGEAPPARALRSSPRRLATSAGSAEKTQASRSTPNMPGMKSSSSKTPALSTALLARRQATRKASTKAPKAGVGRTCFCKSCKYRQQNIVWTTVWPSSQSK
mmetsp:Transcript_94999/g.306725  ORF Transcript_94999/g.306725 Transcript_94999/m.306725 type:complete len:255 (-) Transcript_94999:477-1241(-)